MKIIKKTIIPYQGKVYDLTVENSHTYNVESLAVHNSCAGSLIAYCLDITQVDPIKWGTVWERFISRKKACLLPTTYVLTPDGKKQLKDLEKGESIFDSQGKIEQVFSKQVQKHKQICVIELETGEKFTCSPNHKWIVENKQGVRTIKQTSDINPATDKIIRKEM